MHKLSVSLLFIVLCQTIVAQRRFVVIDMETKVPLRDVCVKWGNGCSVSTIWDGSFSLDSAIIARDDTVRSENSVRFSKPGYLGRELQFAELTDTIELLPAFNKLSEVVIWGKYRQNAIGFTLKPPTKDEIAETKGPQSGASIGIGDVMKGIENLLTYKKRKRVKKIKQTLSKY